MADSFTDFIQNLFPSMGQTQRPMLTGTFTDPAGFRASDAAAAYYADPFRKQNAINQASLDAALKQKQADEAAQRVQGMLAGGGAEMSDQGLNPAVAAFLANETLAERDARMGQINSFLTNALNPFAALTGGRGGMFGGIVSNVLGIPANAVPAPVVDMSVYSPGGYTGDTGSGTIGGTTVGIDAPAVAVGNEGAGLGFASGAGGGESMGGHSGTGMDASNADSIGGWL